MLCKQCLKYHSKDRVCKMRIVKCDHCNHHQKTSHKTICDLKCGVCNKYKFKELIQ